MPTMPINAQLTEAIAASSMSGQGGCAPRLAVPVPVAALMADPPIRGTARLPRISPLRGIPLYGRFSTPVGEKALEADVRTRRKPRISVRGEILK
ncbi:hypothetical protein GCM10009549_05680 [Streptomyces thermoalcalitolerans]|uniref:Uncharacterized protein n=1 Tax=Streptomyces thermoalcalitolerans TaxID=65605 RepID=A0ABP3YR59_9ACTN